MILNEEGECCKWYWTKKENVVNDIEWRRRKIGIVIRSWFLLSFMGRVKKFVQ